jgi:hypothetical protein
MMADEITTLIARRDRLAEIRAKGIRAYEIDGRRIEYRSDAEVAAALADVERRIATLQGNRITTVQLYSSKGLQS